VVPALEAVVVGAVAVTARALQASHADLTIVQWRVLILLTSVGEPLSMGDLAIRLGSTRSATSRLVGRLVRRSLVDVREAAHDRRSRIVLLTPAGNDLVKRVRANRTRELERVAIHAADAAAIVRLGEAFRQFD
jgi:DNA-binding MarR family transcriptional regulator